MALKAKKNKLPPLGPDLTEEQARAIYRQGEEASVWAFLELAKQVRAAGQPPTSPTPATPSAMIPTFQKPTAKRAKRPGRKPGHSGAPRPEGGAAPRRATAQGQATKEKGPASIKRLKEAQHDRAFERDLVKGSLGATGQFDYPPVPCHRSTARNAELRRSRPLLKRSPAL